MRKLLLMPAAAAALQSCGVAVAQTDHPFDAVKDVTPITLAVRSVVVLCAHPSVPANDVAELVEQAKDNPGKLSYGSSGNDSPGAVA